MLDNAGITRVRIMATNSGLKNFDLLARTNGQSYLVVFRPIGLIQMTLNRAAWRVHEKTVAAI